MPQDTRIALFLLAELVAAPQANDPDTFTLYGGIQDLGEQTVTELLLDWMTYLSYEWEVRGWWRGVAFGGGHVARLRDSNT